MHNITRLLTLRRFAAMVFALVFVALYVMVSVGVVPVNVLRDRFEAALQPIIALSVSLVIFPFMSVPAVESIVSRAERVGKKASTKFIEDYVHGCYTVFLLAVAEMVLVIVYSFLKGVLLLLLAVPTLTTLIIVLLILVYSLWRITLLLQRTLA